MSFSRWFTAEGTPCEVEPEDLRREERRLAIREEQSAARLQEVLAAREDAFARGAASTSLSLRRILARRFAGATAEQAVLETELLRVGKDRVTAHALLRAGATGRRAQPLGNALAELQVAYEDDAVGEAAYRDALLRALGLPAPATDPVADVFRVWRALDRGEFPDAAAARRALDGDGAPTPPPSPTT